MDPSFEFAEHIVFYGSYSWRLEDGELRYHGTDSYDAPSIGPIPVSSDQIVRFIEALDSLDVWHWKPIYAPEDVGYCIDDGGSWSFKAHLGGRKCKTAGDNAYPSFESVEKTSLEPERLNQFIEHMQSVFGIPPHQPTND